MASLDRDEDLILDIPGVHAELQALGFDYSEKAVRYMATNRRLPFFVGPDGRRLFMRRSALHRWIRERQAEAERCNSSPNVTHLPRRHA